MGTTDYLPIYHKNQQMKVNGSYMDGMVIMIRTQTKDHYQWENPSTLTVASTLMFSKLP